MISKQSRLTTKDIHYMLKRAYRHKGELFVFLTIPQYPNKRYHQRSISVPVTFDKRAVVRNKIKRLFYTTIQSQAMTSQPFSRFGYQKIFVYFNKYLQQDSPVSRRTNQSRLSPNKKTPAEITYISTRIQQEITSFIHKQYQ